MAIPQSFIQELISRADIVEIVGRYVTLKKGGANFMGLCPFHGEKSPSFTVSPTKQFFHCFGCGKHGNAIGFMMEHVGMNFVEAVKDLAQQYGLQVPEDDASPEERQRAAEQRQKQVTLSDVLEKAGEAYRKHLKESPRAIEYLKGRGLSGIVAKEFGLGYAPEGWRSLASVFPDYSDALLVESGLVILNHDEGSGEEKRYDRFRDRVMFPIRNVKGECIGFGGRVMGDGTPKYLNSPETPVFSKGRELYGLFEARHALRDFGYALVTEGYMDVVALAQLGFPNAVATLGTACTTDHIQKLFRFTDAVVFSFDGDGAGRRAARKALDAALPYATDLRSVKFLFLPAEHDPDSFIREQGAEAFARCVGDALPLSKFLLEAIREGCEAHTAEGRAKMASHAKPLWSAMPEGALKRQLLADIAELVQLPGADLVDMWQAHAAAPGLGPASRKSAYPGPSQDPQAPQNDYEFNSKEFSPNKRKWVENYPKKFGKGGPWQQALPNQGPRVKPTSREDHAARLLLSHSHAWEQLSNEEHALLCALPSPHGPLFSWIDSQHHEHGPLPWGTLSETLEGQPMASFAKQIMGMPVAEVNTTELRQELADVMRRLTLDQLEKEKDRLISVMATEPGARERFSEIVQRWNALKRQTTV